MAELPTEGDLRQRRQEVEQELERLVESHRSPVWTRKGRATLNGLLNEIDRLDKAIEQMAAEDRAAERAALAAERAAAARHARPGDVRTGSTAPTAVCAFCGRRSYTDRHRCTNCGAPLG